MTGRVCAVAQDPSEKWAGQESSSRHTRQFRMRYPSNNNYNHYYNCNYKNCNYNYIYNYNYLRLIIIGKMKKNEKNEKKHKNESK